MADQEQRWDQSNPNQKQRPLGTHSGDSTNANQTGSTHNQQDRPGQGAGQNQGSKSKDRDREGYDIFALNSVYPDAGAIFSHSYKPLKLVKDSCLVVFDTSVLLLPYESKKERFIENFENECRTKLLPLRKQNRLFVPGQVAREFARRRGTLLAELYKTLADNRSKLVFPTVPQVQSSLLTSLPVYGELAKQETALKKLLEETTKEQIKAYKLAVDKVLEQIEGWYWDDPISQLYTELFGGEAGAIVDPELTREAKEEIRRDLDRRQQHKIPPGYEDAGKEDRGVGDLLIWHTILELGRTNKKDLILVSNDQKKDWWVQSFKPLYPRHELVDEYRRVSGGATLHILTFADLLELYGAKTEVVESVRREESRQTTMIARGYGLMAAVRNTPFWDDAQAAFEVVRRWVAQRQPGGQVILATDKNLEGQLHLQDENGAKIIFYLVYLPSDSTKTVDVERIDRSVDKDVKLHIIVVASSPGAISPFSVDYEPSRAACSIIWGFVHPKGFFEVTNIQSVGIPQPELDRFLA